MSKIAYKNKKFRQESLSMIEQANDIIDEYIADGLKLTVRQLYYQFVARGLIENTQREYSRLQGLISNGRMAGYIDWEAIEDRTRNLQRNSHWTNPGSIIRSAARSFMLDRWANQDFHVEVWIEKEALAGVIEGICRELDVAYFACRGYVSQSEMWSAAMRLRNYCDRGKQPVIIHLGDHDPSGIDMTRDILDRQNLFFELEGDIEVNRIALNIDQVEEFNPPPNPAKLSDTRAVSYINLYGSESWELDALEPRVLRELIRTTVTSYRDYDSYQELIDLEAEYIETLERVAANWEDL